MPSRRSAISLSPEEIRKYLDSQKTLIIVSNGRDGFPHPMPIYLSSKSWLLRITMLPNRPEVWGKIECPASPPGSI